MQKAASRNKGALLVDLSQASSDARLPAFNLRGAVISYLDRGDRHDLKTGVTTPAAHKLREARIDPTSSDYKPYLRHDQYFLDILADSAIVTVVDVASAGPSIQIHSRRSRM